MNLCGECTACCDSLGYTQDNEYTRTHPDVVNSKDIIAREGIKYDFGTTCNKLCGDTGDCTIYENRPPICSNFRCSYLELNLEKEYRPDQCGFISAFEGDDLVITPLLTGQLKINPTEWKQENLDKVREVVEEISFAKKKYHPEVYIQTTFFPLNRVLL